MRGFVVYSDTLVEWLSLFQSWVVGITIFPFVFLRKEVENDSAYLSHERIHLVQQAELLLVGFWLLYAVLYVVGRVKGLDHISAYKNIVFEKEAYKHMGDPEYPFRRRLWAWISEK